jgi:hypothetical protein
MEYYSALKEHGNSDTYHNADDPEDIVLGKKQQKDNSV